MWILFASLNPFSEAIRSYFAKKASADVDPMLISWANNFLPVLIFSPGLFFIELKFSAEFWAAFLATGIINSFVTIIYMRAISLGDISEVMPMLSFTPLFLLITSPIIVGEFPNVYGFAGVILVVLGSYLLNVDLRKRDFLAPIKALLKNKGSRLMLLVSFVWSLTANFDKLSIQYSSVAQHIILINIFIFFTVGAIVLANGKFNSGQIKKGKKNLLLVSAFTVGSFIFHMTALSMTLVAYVISMKRMSGMFSVFLGHFLLNEPHLRERLLGSAVMFIGVLLIVFS